jgi:SAM-dependent methyltransferase
MHGPASATIAALPDWVGTLYDDLLAEVLLRRDDVARETAFLVRTLGLRPGMRVLDQGCGLGSLAIPLARRGIAVVGVDQCARYVAQAREDAAVEELLAEFACAEAGGYRPPAPVDGAFSWWTSWGHAGDDAGNLALLRAAHDALVPGGTFVLDAMNVCGVLGGFLAETELVRTVPRLGGEVRLHRASRIDAAAGLLHKDWTYVLPDGVEVRRTSTMRLYMPWEVGAMLAEVGFAEVAMLGSTAGEPLAPDSPRLLAVARRA